MNLLQQLPRWSAAACAVVCATGLQAQLAQNTGHYPAGVEGIKAGSIPPPGLYFRDYNAFYAANQFEEAAGPVDFSVFSYVNAPRLIWITEQKVLGADWGMDVLLPIFYNDVEVNGAKFDEFGIGDVCIEPILLAWHGARYDLGVGYGFWAPIGDFDAGNPASVGKGFWSHMFTVGGTYYFDEKKTWAASVLNRFEVHHRNTDTDITPGASSTLEWGISKTVRPNLDVGVVGYYAQQLSDDSGSGVGAGYPTINPRVFAAGGEVSGLCPFLGMIASLRYVHGFGAEGRPEGGLGVFTLTKRF